MLLGFLLASLPHATSAGHAYLLDTGGLRNTEELYLVGVLQGIVNRDAPRLFISAIDGTLCAGANNVYVDYLEKKKGFTFTRLKSLGDAVATFARMKRNEGVTPLIKGLIRYPTSYWDHAKKCRVDLYYNSWIAANFAAQEDLLPVSDTILAHQTPMLSGSDFWYQDTAMKSGWDGMFVEMKRPEDGGLAVSIRPDANPQIGAYAVKWVYLDLDVTPKIEVVVSDLSPGGSWSLGVRMPTTVDTMESSGCVNVPGLTKINRTGTFVVDLAASGLFNPRVGRAGLRISPSGHGVSVRVESVRLLDAKGEVPRTPPFLPGKDVFQGLKIKRDLVDSPPYEQNEEKACEWSLRNQRENCDPTAFGSFAGGAWILKGIDYAIAKKVYLFYQDESPYIGNGYPNLERILKDLKPPALVYGWLAGESYSCMKMGQHGARYAGGPPENFSFWQWVPLEEKKRRVSLPQAREVPKLANKTYVNFSWASADAIQFSYDLMDGFWQDPNRGQVPVTWGFNPLLARFAPALVEFYAHSATPRDSFWGWTAGYTHPSGFPPDRLNLYAEETRSGISLLGLSPAVDVWDAVRDCRETYESLSKSSRSSPGVKLMSVLPNSRGPETYWLDNGAVVVRNDKRFHSVHQWDGKSTPETLMAALGEIDQVFPGRDPRFITINSRFSPTFIKQFQDILPSNVEIVGMPDFIGLAEEFGAVVAVPFSDSVGSGDHLKVSFELHNPSGASGGAGKVTWKLPPGWKSVPEEWQHGPVPQCSNLKRVVTFMPPPDMANGRIPIVYKDSRFEWDKEFFVTTYPQSMSVTDCETLTNWAASEGASVSMDRDMIKITPRVMKGRGEYFENKLVETETGRVTIPLGSIDFDRNPILKLHIPDQYSEGTKIGLSYKSEQTRGQILDSDHRTSFIDLNALSKWKGTRDVVLTIDPATKFGRYVRIRSIKVCYPAARTDP